jgi:type VI secretion system protein ImpH
MATKIRYAPNRVASNAELAKLSSLSDEQGFWRALEEAPYAFDLFFSMRWVEARHTTGPRLGYAARPADEPLRIAQQPSLMFAPATIASVTLSTDGRAPVISQYAFGLFGPSGPLPLHLTELAHERVTTAGDHSLSGFLDLFHHRASMLFYRAWADAQSTVSLDRAGQHDNFSRYVGSLIGYGLEHQKARDDVPDHSKRHVAGHLSRSVRSPESLQRMLEIYFGFAVQVQEWALAWLALPRSQQTRLGDRATSAQLGVGAVAGAKVPDKQHRFRLRLGPMPLADYEKLLPVGANFQSLIDWVRNFSGYEFAWDARLVLRGEDVPATKLGGTTRLGWTSWLGSRKASTDADDLVLQPENYVNGPGRVATE